MVGAPPPAPDRTLETITSELVEATRELQHVRTKREEAVALLADRDGALVRLRWRMTQLREELLALIDRRARHGA